MRSVENGRSLARSANSGVSLVTDRRGRIVERMGIFERGVIVRDLPLSDELTFYARHGDVFPWSVSAVALLMVLASWARGRRR
jgi:apolipoprotein N-acyltransferase